VVVDVVRCADARSPSRISAGLTGNTRRFCWRLHAAAAVHSAVIVTVVPALNVADDAGGNIASKKGKIMRFLRRLFGRATKNEIEKTLDEGSHKESAALTLAARAHDFRESEDWGGAAKCYEEILVTCFLPLDRAKTLANLMQMYDKLGDKQKALNAGLEALDFVANAYADSSEVLHLRGYVRGYVSRLQGRAAPKWTDTGAARGL